MWRCGDAPSMWQMCDSPGQEMLVGLSDIELGNLLAGLHPRDVKRHGYTITRVLCTLCYLEAKAEKMYQAGKQTQTNLSAAQRTIAFNNNRRILEEARRNTQKRCKDFKLVSRKLKRNWRSSA